MEGSTKVVIIGAGLVGSLAACYLGRKGYEVHVFEKRKDPRGESLESGRSINLAISNRGRRALRQIGLEGAVLRQAIPMVGRYIHSKNGKCHSLLYDPAEKQCIFSVKRQDINDVLLNEASQMPNVTFHFERQLIELNSETTTMKFLSVGKGQETLHADLIVGADGVHSTVRKMLIQSNDLTSYGQTCIPHKYVQLTVPAENSHMMLPNHLHIWPRGEFMMIALPNQDSTWTVTLFMPSVNFEEITQEDSLLEFFSKHFPDSIAAIGRDTLAKQYFSSKPHSLYSIKCQKYHAKNVVIIGDAAHAMVPFYGQGMNAGFEDVRILDELLNTARTSAIAGTLEEFSKMRNPDAEAICDLAIYNYVEMRDLINRKSFLLGRTLDNVLHFLFPEQWVPLYKSVTFTDTRYSVCVQNKRWQAKFLKKVQKTVILLGVIALAFILGWMVPGKRDLIGVPESSAHDDVCQT